MGQQCSCLIFGSRHVRQMTSRNKWDDARNLWALVKSDFNGKTWESAKSACRWKARHRVLISLHRWNSWNYKRCVSILEVGEQKKSNSATFRLVMYKAVLLIKRFFILFATFQREMRA